MEFVPLLHYRHIEVDKETNLKLNQGNFDSFMTLSHDSSDSLEEIHWWSANILTASTRIFHYSPDVFVYTDASQMGWGAQIEHGNNTSGIWSKSESSRHINYLELLAVKLALSSLLNARYNIHVRVMSDNNTAVSYINSMGGCRSLECNSIAKDIWDWAIDKDIWLSAAHIPGSSNIDADQLSRNLNLDLEWMLSAPIFQRIVALFGKPDIDLFASRLNAQVEDYVSWKPHPMAKFVDAFTIFLLCLSSILSCFKVCTENNSRPGIRNSSNSLVDNSALFYGCTEPTNRNATCIQCFSSEPDSSNSGRSSSPTPTTAVDGMQVIRRSLQESEISPDIVDIIMHSWRDSTQKQYKVYINKWLQFCSERKIDPLHPTVTAVLSFLHSLFKSGLSYSALNTARSAVSNIGMSDSDAPSHTPVGKHFLVCRYLKGVFNKLKPVPQFKNIWSVDTVLDYLSLFWPLHEINLKELTLKLVMLIALTTGQRCQTLRFFGHIRAI